MLIALDLNSMPKRIQAQFQDGLKRALFDCTDRFDLDKKRCVTLQLTLVPQGKPDKDGLVPMEWTGDIKVTLPPFTSAVYSGKVLANESKEGVLIINDESLDNVNQATIDQFMQPGGQSPQPEDVVSNDGEVRRPRIANSQ